MAGVGGIGLNGNVKNAFNWAPRLGATYQLDAEDGPARRATAAATTSACSDRCSATR